MSATVLREEQGKLSWQSFADSPYHFIFLKAQWILKKDFK